ENIEKEAATILNDVETNVDDINKDVNSDIHPQHLHDIIEARLAELAPSETSANKTETIEVAAKIESDISTEQQNQIEDVSVETSSTTINFHSKDVETEAEFLETDVTATDAQAETNLATHPIYLIETASVADIMLADLKEENVNKISDGTENLTTQNASEKHTFSQWLKQLTKDAQVAEVHANEPLAPFKTNINSSTVIIESTNNNPADSSIHSNSEPKPDSHNSINHLIDKFIDEQPRIEPQKSNFYSPSVAARNSVIFNDSVVSETLALIFEKQQLYQKAINAYEKLSLMFPEKSDLFAARISVLKQKKGNSH
ncbi:MAG TPA: hypothetical protein PLO59_06145, partial [Bacteroidia bacterium]|nr:hypothetical protein [Bacteroidia bacterium]